MTVMLPTLLAMITFLTGMGFYTIDPDRGSRRSKIAHITMAFGGIWLGIMVFIIVADNVFVEYQIQKYNDRYIVLQDRIQLARDGELPQEELVKLQKDISKWNDTVSKRYEMCSSIITNWFANYKFVQTLKYINYKVKIE